MLGIKIHKNIKQLYYAKNALLLLIPRWFFQNRLHRMILSGTDDDIDYLNKRVNYYNKLNDRSLLQKVKSLMSLEEEKTHNLFFDSYEVTRYFNPKLHVNFEFGDITKVAKIHL